MITNKFSTLMANEIVQVCGGQQQSNSAAKIDASTTKNQENTQQQPLDNSDPYFKLKITAAVLGITFVYGSIAICL